MIQLDLLLAPVDSPLAAAAVLPNVRGPIDAACASGTRYFASGSNHPGEITGLAECGIDVGVAIHDLHSAGEAAIVEAVRTYGVRVFVDSGAFSEIGFGPTGPFVAHPISEAEWERRLDAYVRLAKEIGSALYCVAPDMVAFQSETLARMQRWAYKVREAARYGANVLVPVQKGALPMATFWDAARAALGVPDAQLVAAVPMKKDATTTAEFAAFLATAKPARCHLLGLGPKSPRFAEVIEAAYRASRYTEMFCDSVLITSLVGRTNGKGRGARPLTLALDAAYADVEDSLFRGDIVDIDWTEAASAPSEWLTRAGLRRVASELAATGLDVAGFEAAPEEWLQDGDRYADPRVELALESAWAEYARGPGSTTWRKRSSINRLFGGAQ